MRAAQCSGVLWLDVDFLVQQALADFDKGKVLSVPGASYKAIAGATRALPRGVLQRFQPARSPPMGVPLADVVVLDLTRALAGPDAAMMLGDLGARVIKVERPSGDDTRGWGPPFVGATTDGRCRRTSSRPNRNKESITLDFKNADDHEVLERLVERADIVIENFRAGVLDRLGVPLSRMQELNPRS